jgi:hypothetical protein
VSPSNASPARCTCRRSQGKGLERGVSTMATLRYTTKAVECPTAERRIRATHYPTYLLRFSSLRCGCLLSPKSRSETGVRGRVVGVPRPSLPDCNAHAGRAVGGAVGGGGAGRARDAKRGIMIHNQQAPVPGKPRTRLRNSCYFALLWPSPPPASCSSNTTGFKFTARARQDLSQLFVNSPLVFRVLERRVPAVFSRKMSEFPLHASYSTGVCFSRSCPRAYEWRKRSQSGASGLRCSTSSAE